MLEEIVNHIWSENYLLYKCEDVRRKKLSALEDNA